MASIIKIVKRKPRMRSRRRRTQMGSHWRLALIRMTLMNMVLMRTKLTSRRSSLSGRNWRKW